jgi:hypothetical protein
LKSNRSEFKRCLFGTDQDTKNVGEDPNDPVIRYQDFGAEEMKGDSLVCEAISTHVPSIE